MGTITRNYLGVTEVTTYTLIEGYDADKRSNNKTIELLSGAMSTVLLPSRSRSGQLKAFYPVYADAFAAWAILSNVGTFALSDAARPLINMNFVIPEGGGVRLELDPQTRDRWMLVFDFREVL